MWLSCACSPSADHRGSLIKSDGIKLAPDPVNTSDPCHLQGFLSVGALSESHHGKSRTSGGRKAREMRRGKRRERRSGAWRRLSEDDVNESISAVAEMCGFETITDFLIQLTSSVRV